MYLRIVGRKKDRNKDTTDAQMGYSPFQRNGLSKENEYELNLVVDSR